MDRREFLASSAAAATVATLPWREALAASASWRTFETTMRIEIQSPRGVSRVWLPLPAVHDVDWQKVVGNTWTGNSGRTQLLNDGKYGVAMLYAEWPAGSRDPVLELVSRFSTRDRAIDLEKPNPNAPVLSASETAFFTAPTELIPTDGIVRETALEITKSARTDIEKARAIYEWTVDNTYRDPGTRGCGWGDIKSMLETRNLGGKCADLNTIFVGLARAVGVPARDVYGVRVAPSAQGYRSLGTSTQNISRAQHCRAEFFAEGYGWVPVDPADVRKVILEEPPGNLAPSHERVVAARKLLFGAWEMNWVAYNMSHDVTLAHSSSGSKLPYLMYPNGETGGERLDQLEPEQFKYTITWREINA